MHVAVIQMAIAHGNKAENYSKVRRMTEQALEIEPRPDVILLPELWSTGYALDSLEKLASGEGEEEERFLAELARKHNIWFAGGSVAAKTSKGIVNRAQVIDRSGELKASYDKIHLVPMLNEHKYLIAGDSPCVIDIEGITFGFAICYDIRFGEFLHQMALRGAQVIAVSAEWPLVRLSHWQTLLKARAIENQCYVLAANNVAMDPQTFAGHSVVHAPDGSTLCQFEFQEDVKSAFLDGKTVNEIRKAIPVFQDRRPEVYSREREEISP